MMERAPCQWYAGSLSVLGISQTIHDENWAGPEGLISLCCGSTGLLKGVEDEEGSAGTGALLRGVHRTSLLISMFLSDCQRKNRGKDVLPLRQRSYESLPRGCSGTAVCSQSSDSSRSRHPRVNCGAVCQVLAVCSDGRS